MKYLKRFNENKEEPFVINDLINEKITWKEILLWGSIFIGVSQFKNEYSKYQYLKNLYSLVNSENKPKGKEKEICENIRKSLINDIKESPEWKKFNKKQIIDSILNVQFLIIDSNEIFVGDKLGCFINLENIKSQKSIASKLLEEPKENNIIAINRKTLFSPICEDIVKHEIYHYISKLENYPFDNPKLVTFFDKNISDKDYLSKKISILMFLRKNELLDLMKIDINKFKMTDQGKEVNLYNIAKYLVDEYQNKINYYEGEDEIFARWEVLKSDMYKSGFKKDKITTDDIQKYLLTISSDDKLEEVIDILLALDWNKLDEFQNFVKSNN